MPGLTYKQAGVDIEEGDKFVELIKPLAKRTFRPEVMGGIGLFSALFRLDVKKYKEPVLVSGTDGVGTKLKIAFMSGRHDTVGIDLVAMCVNDILTSGAEPLFFLDYFATGRLKAETAAKVIEGIASGCEESGCALIGGETAEMPGFYGEGEYDLAGFAVGVVEKDGIIDGSGIRKGDALIGLLSSGLHSNGYSLARKLFFDLKKMDINGFVPELGCTLSEELLKPTRIYVKAYNALKGKGNVKGMAHITGGGITGNLPRILPGGMRAVVNEDSWPRLPIFKLVKELGGLDIDEMRKTFNMGIGFIMAVDKDSAAEAVTTLNENGYPSYIIGRIERGGEGVEYA